MSSRFQSRGWRRCRSFLRGIRIGILVLLFLLVAAGFWLNKIGLPGFLKKPLLEKLQARGLDLQFTRLRLRYYRGIVAENVRFGQTDDPVTGPRFSAREAELKLNHAALRHFEVTFDSVILHGGEFAWPLAETNQPARKLSVDDIQTRIRFLPNDQWELDHFNASFAGARLQLSGSITNASALRDWQVRRAPAEAQPAQLQNRLRRLADAVERIKFSDVPELKLVLHGDGRDPQSFNGVLTASTQSAETPWGSLTNGNLTARLLAPDATNSRPHGEFILHADDALTRWGSTKNFQLELRAVADPAETNLVHCRLNLSAARFATEWAAATNAQFTAQWSHSLTNPIPTAGHGELRLSDARTRWGRAGELRLNSRLSTPTTNGPPKANSDWGWWACLEPYFLDWNCRLINVQAQDFEVGEVAFGGVWRAPALTITNLHSELYQGQVNVQAAMDVTTRKLTFIGASDFDAQKIAPLLTEGGRDWLQRFSWEKPPLVHGQGEMILPAWTNRQPDWRDDLLSTLQLQGEFQAGPASFRGMHVLSAQSHILFSNLTWNLPDLVATRPEGQVRLAHVADDRTHEFYFRVHSDIDIQAVRPLLATQEQVVFDTLKLPQPPLVDAEIWGRWHDLEKIGIKAQITTSNFTARGESGTQFHTDLQYTNLFLHLDHPQVERGTQSATADSLDIDFREWKLYLTNGFSTIEPMAIVHAIGPKVTKAIEPYHFLQPPTVRVNGVVPLHDEIPADLHFEVDGGPFIWNKFKLAHVTSGVHWVGDHLGLSGARADFYGGHLTGSAAFDFVHGDGGTEFSFDTIATDANLGLLMADLFSPSNHLEGTLNGHLNITKANTDDWKSWFGKGQVDLQDGLIWDIPIFGIFSEPLNSIVPGLGKSRASEGSGTFVITNSVIRSDDLEIRAPALRMLYRGTVDFDGRTDAVVEAELLRDTWLVGPLVSRMLWPITKLFEYKVTGTLSQPKPVPLFLPKILSMPLHPFRTLKELMGNPPNTNPPPATVPPPGKSP
ncbi:MAG: hypothetical protein JWR69_74 [Pedosphaera sp.]|nr:hypothetical protein [Pedosphaera sp.]